MDKVSLFCFGASYFVALLFHLLNQWKQQRWFYIFEIGFASAGFIAQSIYLSYWQPPLATQYGWFLLSSWLLIAFYVYSSLNYRQIAWGLFILPLVLVLIISAAVFSFPTDTIGNKLNGLVLNTKVFGWIHVFFLLTATLATFLASLSSLMYLLQSYQVRNKFAPGAGINLLNLEKLEVGIRYGIAIGFPLLSIGLLTGLLLLLQVADKIQGWWDPRVISSFVLWLSFANLVYARYGLHMRGKKLAWVTISAFVLLLVCLALPHQIPMEVGK